MISLNDIASDFMTTIRDTWFEEEESDLFGSPFNWEAEVPTYHGRFLRGGSDMLDAMLENGHMVHIEIHVSEYQAQ